MPDHQQTSDTHQAYLGKVKGTGQEVWHTGEDTGKQVTLPPALPALRQYSHHWYHSQYCCCSQSRHLDTPGCCFLASKPHLKGTAG